MLKLYEEYLQVIDEYIAKCFESQWPFIHCKKGCTDCCEIGEYPFSRLEMEYLMAGFPTLSTEIQRVVRQNIKDLLVKKSECRGRFLHQCPFLIEKRCALYARRGITCRVFGLASYETVEGKRIVRLPECSRIGLNYCEVLVGSEVDMNKFQAFGVNEPVKHSLKLDFFEKDLLQGTTGIEFGEIRPILEWFQ